MYRVVSTSLDFGRFSREPIDLLVASGCTFESVQIDARSEEQGIAAASGADVLIVGLQRVDEPLLARAPRLRVIGRCGAGLDNIDLAAAGRRGIPVVYTPGANAEAVADLTFGLMLSLSRRIGQTDRMTRTGEWKRVIGSDVCGKTLAIFGLGQIGFNVARRAAGFGMRVLACDVAPNLALARPLGIEYAKKEELLRLADFVTLHLPLLPETRHFIGEAELLAMKPSAILVNTSRGGIVDEQALCAALCDGRIAGAALDVFEREPPGSSPLFGLENFIGTPHIAGVTGEAIAAIGIGVASDIVAVLAGRPPRFLANGPFLAGAALRAPPS